MLLAAASLNAIALYALWLFGQSIIKPDDLSSLNRWLMCILVAGAIPALAAVWFVFRQKNGLALGALFTPVPLWTLITTVLVALEFAGIKI